MTEAEVPRTAPAYDYRAAREAVFGSALLGTSKLVLLALVEFMPHCSPSVQRLTDMCGVARRTVLRTLSQLEELKVLSVERTTGERSVYQLHLESLLAYRPEPDQCHGDTGDRVAPVPWRHPTGAMVTPDPCHGDTPTGVMVTPEAVKRSRSDGSEAGVARAREAGARLGLVGAAGVSRTVTMPSEEPPQSYLDAAVMGGVRLEQARSTWAHYFGAGLPQGGVERLEHWLVQRAKERQERTAKLPSGGGVAPARGVELDTTGAATAFRPTNDDAAFCAAHELDLNHALRLYRAGGEHEQVGTVESQRRFSARLRCWAATGKFIAEGPLPKARKTATGNH